MAVKIGHASIDENGRAYNGQAGDQTKKEVCTRTWYNKSWDVVLRPKTATMAEKIARAVEQACANDNVGYDQYQRNTLRKLAEDTGYNLSKVGKCECDCSSLAGVAALAGGARIEYGYNQNGPVTSNMRRIFKESGDFDVLTASKYLTSEKYLQRGDIIVNEGSHTVIVLSDGDGVKPVPTPIPAKDQISVDGEWGKSTTRATQKVLGTVVDGVVSKQLKSQKKYMPNCLTSSWEFKTTGTKGGSAMVKALQKLVGSAQDGHMGPNTIKAMQTFLNKNGFNCGSVDGYMGPTTVKAWQKYINSRL